MADIKQPPQPQTQDFASQLTEGIGLPEAPQQTALPSVPEAQEETQQQVELEKEINRKKRQIAAGTKHGIKDVSDLEAQAELMKDVETEEAAAAEQAQAELETQQQEQTQLDDALLQYQELKSKYTEKGIPFKPDERFEQALQERQVAEQEQLVDARRNEEIAKRLAKFQVQQEEDAQEASKLEAEKQIQKEMIRPDMARQQVIEEVQNEDRARKQTAIDQEMRKIQQEREAIANKPFSSFWANKSTGDKILAAVALALGGIGSGLTGGPNQALQIIQNQMNQDFEQQKYTKKQKLDAVNGRIEAIQLKLKQAAMQTDDRNRQLNSQILQQKLEQMKQANIQQRLKSAIISQRGEIPVSMMSEEEKKAVQQLRSEYNKQTKDLGTAEIIAQYKQIQQFADEPSAAGDIGLIFSYMKILDPRSVVREGEFATAQNAGGIPERIRAMYNKTVSGKRLAEAQRKDFSGQAKKIVESKLKAQRMINRRYHDLSQQYQVPSSAVVQNFDIKEIAELSPREKLIQIEMKKNPKLSRDKIEKNIDKLVDKGQLNPLQFGK